MKYLICTYERTYIVSADSASKAVMKFYSYCGYGQSKVLELLEASLDLPEFVEAVDSLMMNDTIIAVVKVDMTELYGNINTAFYVIE